MIYAFVPLVRAPPMPDLRGVDAGQFIGANGGRLARRWADEVRELDCAIALDEQQLVDGLPDIVRALLDDLALQPALDAHFAQRQDSGFSARDVVREFVLLGRVLLEALEEGNSPELLLERVGLCIDHTVRASDRGAVH